MLLEWISRELGLEQEYVAALAKTASHHYKRYAIPKRSGGLRQIFHPSKELKGLQRWLLRRVVSRLPVHEAAMGYRKGTGIAMNARLHANSRYLLRIDFEDFFPSITSGDILRHLQNYRAFLPSAWQSDDDMLFVQIACREGVLTIGSVTSPALSNTLCYSLDGKITSLCRTRDVTYTRYADDLFFSTNKARVLSDIEKELREIVGRLDCPAALKINSSKTRHFSKRHRRVVTGIVLRSDGDISLGRALKRSVKSRIHKYDSLDPDARISLAGLLAYCQDVEPDFLNRLILKFGWDKVEVARRGEARG